jgi:hypothetical protein
MKNERKRDGRRKMGWKEERKEGRKKKCRQEERKEEQKQEQFLCVFFMVFP